MANVWAQTKAIGAEQPILLAQMSIPIIWYQGLRVCFYVDSWTQSIDINLIYGAELKNIQV